MSITEIIVTLLSACLGGGLVTALSTKKLTKAQSESLVVATVTKVNEGLVEQVKEMRIEISELREEGLKAKAENEKCNLKHEIGSLEMMQLKKHNVFKDYEKDKVFVLDDDPEILEQFREVLDKSPVLDYRGFLNSKEFIEDANKFQPPCLVIDYRVPPLTAEQIMASINYGAQIFIISAEEGYERRFLGRTNIQFFVKEELFVYKISMVVIKYLNDKK